MYQIHKLTGQILVDGNGRPMGAESGGVVGTHPTLEAAEREFRKLNRLGNGINAGRYQIRDDENNPVEIY